jgi:hypothetical protein
MGPLVKLPTAWTMTSMVPKASIILPIAEATLDAETMSVYRARTLVEGLMAVMA